MDFQTLIDFIKGEDSITQDSDVVENVAETDASTIDAYDAKSDIDALRKEMNDSFAQLNDAMAMYIARGGLPNGVPHGTAQNTAHGADSGEKNAFSDLPENFDRFDFSDLKV